MTEARFTSSAKDPKAADCSRIASNAWLFLSRLGRGDAEDFVFPSPRGRGYSHSLQATLGHSARPQVWTSSAAGVSRRVPRSPTPTEAQPCHTRCAEGRGRIHGRSVTRQARLLGITWLQILWTAVSASWLMRSCLLIDEELAKPIDGRSYRSGAFQVRRSLASAQTTTSPACATCRKSRRDRPSKPKGLGNNRHNRC